MSTPSHVTHSPEVSVALAAGQPVVALETTILTFGLPIPANAEVGAACEAAIRAGGSVPATSAILDGEVKVGLTGEEIAYFCSRAPEIRKVNLQNFAACVASRAPGALTVAASMKACALGGVKVFATGGIGGVHRGWSEEGRPGALDLSSDLMGLARFPVAVVCAGAKSVLDVPATLEALESLGVPVVGFRAKSFPLFYSPESPYPIETSFDDEAELAAFLRTHFELGGEKATGVLIVNPVPEADGLAREEVEEWTTKALAEAKSQEVQGKKVTPFLLARMEALSGGRSLAANRALVVNNSAVAGRVAAKL